MKMLKKIISLALAVVMMASIFTAINFTGLQTEIVTAEDNPVDATYRIIEIVPTSSKATFGYLISGKEPIKIADYIKASGDVAFGSNLMTLGLGTVVESGSEYAYTSGNWFVENCLPKKTESGASYNWTVDFRTYTPKQLKAQLANTTFVNDFFNNVDLFVFNDTNEINFPTKSAKGSNYTNNINSVSMPSGYDSDGHSSFKECTEFDWNLAYTLFKKIAGADGLKPAAYIFDYQGINTILSDKNECSLNAKYAYADSAYGTATSSNGNSSSANCTDNVLGSKNNVYKLFSMCTRMNPSTFYSLFFKTAEDWYGINPEDGSLKAFELYNNSANYGTLGRVGLGSWSEKMLDPYFLCSSSGDLSKVKTDIGWCSSDYFEAYNSPDATFRVNFNDKYRKHQRGIVYNNTDGLLSLIKANASDMKTNLSSLYSENKVSLDTKEYKFLAVQPNGGGKVNNSNIVSLIKDAESAKKGLVGGLKVDVMSMYQFVNTNLVLKENYDAIYFGAELENNYSSIVSQYGNNGKIYYPSGQTYSKGTNMEWTNKNTSVYPGNDLTANKKNELLDYCKTVDAGGCGCPVIFSNALIDAKNNGKMSNTNMSSFMTSVLSNTSQYVCITDSGNSGITGTVLSDLKNKIDSNKLSLEIISAPVAYESQYDFRFVNESSVNDYDLKGLGAAEPQYVNSGSDKSRNLYFKFRVNGGGTVNAKLYIDMNYDGIFQDSEEYEDWGNVASDGSVISKSCEKIPEDYVGAITWKVVVENSSTKKTASQIGYSAAKKDNSTQVNKTTILQIVPTSEKSKYGAGEFNKDITGYYSLPQDAVLLLPTKDEIEVAKNKHGGTLITSYNPYSQISNIQSYFSDTLTFDTVSYEKNVEGGNYRIDNNMNKAKDLNVSVEKSGGKSYIYNRLADGDWLSRGVINYNETVKIPNIIATSGVYYYFLAKQEDYDVDTYRLSVAKFNELVAENKIQYNSATKTLSYERNKTKVNGTTITTLTETETINIDMLVLGFCESMDLLSADALRIIENYFKDDNCSYVGFGAITANRNNTLAATIRAYMGMDRYNVTGKEINSAETLKNSDGEPLAYTDGLTYKGASYPIGNGNVATSKKTNDGTVAHYPYSIPATMRMTNAAMQPFQLNIEDPNLVVYYAESNISTILDTCSQYYLYKKGGMTYCAFGFNEGNSSGQVSMTMKLPEAALFVNTILANTDTVPNVPPTQPTGKAEVEITNDDAESLPPYTTNDVNGNEVKVTDTYMYVYYDATKTTEGGGTLINDGTDTDVRGSYNCIIAEFEATVPEGTTGNLTFTTSDGTLIPLVFYKASDNTPVSNGNVVNGVKYYVEIPLDDDYYSQSPINKSGYAMTNKNEFSVKFITTTNNDDSKKTVVNLKLVKRGMFTIN